MIGSGEVLAWEVSFAGKRFKTIYSKKINAQP